MVAAFGTLDDLESWMKLVKRVSWNFPGLETAESIEEHKLTVQRFIEKKQAICVKEGETVIGVILFSRKHNMICCLAVAPEYRRQGIASLLLTEAMSHLNRAKDITVSTFREEDPKGEAPRAFYKRFGFVEGELIEEFHYPNQEFILYAESDK